jgi:hypothetical protein
MGTKSRESIYGGSVRASAERAKEARKVADRLAVKACRSGRATSAFDPEQASANGNSLQN